MRRNPTLPTIRQSTNPPTRGKQSLRKLQDRLVSHDQQIIRNEKIISSLAADLRLLKEQLEFEQEYNQKHKAAQLRHEEEMGKMTKAVRDLKAIQAKLEAALREKEKMVESSNREAKIQREKCEEWQVVVEESSKQLRKKEAQLKNSEDSCEKLRREIKEREQQLKEKDMMIKEREMHIREEFETNRQGRDQKQRKIEKELELAQLLLDNAKEAAVSREKEIQKLEMNLFQTQEKLKQAEKAELRTSQMTSELHLARAENESLKNQLQAQTDKVNALELSLKTAESKNAAAQSQKMKLLVHERKEIAEKLDKAQRDAEEYRKRLNSQINEREKHENAAKETKIKAAALQSKLTHLEGQMQKLVKGKTEMGKALLQMKSSVQCQLCGRTMRNPVTNIPCGHSYCQQCKKGYQKQCKKCPGIKREAVYRNQLLDEVITAAALVQKIHNLL